MVAEIGHDLLYAAVCAADEQDDVDIFETAFGHWDPLITSATEECDLQDRCTMCGIRVERGDGHAHLRIVTPPAHNDEEENQ